MGNDANLGEQRASFERFLDLAGAMGARKLRDARVRIVDKGGRRAVALLFSHLDFPGARFAYLAKPPGDDRYEEVWLAEELATGAFHRLMQDTTSAAADDGIVWLHLHGEVLRLGPGP